MTPKLVVPRYPQKSLLLYRQTTRDTVPEDYDPDSQQMPPLATYERNQAALDLLNRWVLEMDTVMAGTHPNGKAFADRQPILRGRELRFPADMLARASEQHRVLLVTLQGRAYPLPRIGAGVYAIPSGLPSGPYFIEAGDYRAFRYLFLSGPL